MNMNETMSFEEAMEFLKTTRSTLYRWLHEGTIPATKLGRQWRFSAQELLEFRDGGADRTKLTAELRELSAFFHTRDPRAKDKRVMEHAASSQADNPVSVAESIIWDAVEQKASDIHMQTRSTGVHLLYRLNGKLSDVRTMNRATADAIQKAWVAMSTGADETGAHRLFSKRTFESRRGEESSNLQVQYQSIDTLQGPRVTLRILHQGKVLDLPRICSKKEDAAIFERWLTAPRGLVIFAGKAGSGKTTTLLSCLNHLTRNRHKAVFSIEDPIEVQLDGVDQIQVDGGDDTAVRNAFLQIYRADLDAVAISVLSQAAARGALDMARGGHLVLLQVHANSIDEAILRIEGWVEETIRGDLVGVCYQELKPDDQGRRKAVYELKSFTA